jgi:hypothetical protein
LNGIGSCLVAPFPAGHVPGNVFFCQRRKPYGRALDAADLVRAVADADAGQHLVTPSGQPPQHRRRLVVVARLAEDFAVHDHGRVGAEDDHVGKRLS